MKKNKKLSIKDKIFKGFSLIEILVVISIFSVLGVLSTRAILLTVRGSKKSDSLVRVRENVNYALSIMERQIRNSESVSPCPNSNLSLLDYVSSNGQATTFSYNEGEKYIASGSARLTSSDILITSCIFRCTQVLPNNPPIVEISIVAEDAATTGIEKGTVSVETQIVTRNF